MPSAIEVVAAIDSGFRQSGASSRMWRDRLTASRMIPPAPGAVRDQTRRDIALTALAVAIGYAASRNISVVAEYADLKAADGRRLLDVMMDCLDRPSRMIELRVVADEPIAGMKYREDNGHVADLAFYGPAISHAPGLKRFSVVDGDAWTKFTHLLKHPASAPDHLRTSWK